MKTAAAFSMVALLSCSHPSLYARTRLADKADCDPEEVTVTPGEDIRHLVAPQTRILSR